MKTKIIFMALWATGIYSTAYAQGRENIEYDFSCMYESLWDVAIGAGKAMEEVATKTFGTEVTMQEEIEIGNLVLEEFKKEYTIISSGGDYDRLNNIKNRLVKKILKPRGFTYKINLIDDDETVNAFTAGGYIFVTTAMVNFCNNNDELACIIGHEIAHNELGHIREQLSKSKTSERIWGKDGGNLADQVYGGLTTSFNQKNEAHCDMLGMDIAKSAGFNICTNIGLWQRMSERDGDQYNFLKMFSSHPYSATRSKCAANHINKTYGDLCD
jgi:predicted Zn-dependent protease